ncbi:BQ5605_C011g06646 [Microbotryum silenes-dioicae]|uniref:BQ5605_C011g06646 protein n=1 Tax=Microbotryum silenes-dioicae TaxID=796604 RepID=A0A2X0LPR0_9BASI|nr:BQ5605_C011g06646 [Microbotryum silenes-dioicae]
MIPCLFLDEDQEYYLNDDEFDRLSPLTNMTVKLPSSSPSMSLPPTPQRYPHFGSLDGAVTAATPLGIGSLICFGLKCGMHSLSCDQTAYGEEALSIGIVTTNQCNQDTLASLVLLSNVVVQELRLIKKTCYSTHLIDGTIPFRMIDGRQVIESLGPSMTTYRSTTDLTSCYPDERLISMSAHAQSIRLEFCLNVDEQCR